MNQANNISEEEFNRIEQYLRHQMTAAQHQAFEKELAEKPELQEQLTKVRALHNELEETIFRHRLDIYHQEIPSQKKPVRKKSRMRIWWAIATVAAVVVFALTLSPVSPTQKIYLKYYYTDPGLPNPMSGSGDYGFNEAMVDYKNEEYHKALEKWKDLLKQKPGNDSLEYFIGSALLASNQRSQALHYFKKVRQQPQSSFAEEAAYYAALIYLKEKDLTSAKASLKKYPSVKNNRLLHDIEKLAP